MSSSAQGHTSQPPPPPPLPSGSQHRPVACGGSQRQIPSVDRAGPVGTFLVELLIYNGFPFKDHWAYFVSSCHDSFIGVVIHATGDVLNGFEFEIKRSHDFRNTLTRPIKRVPLQWVDGSFFDEAAMLNNGVPKFDSVPVCGFEDSAHKVKAPEKTLNAAKDNNSSSKAISQRDCQTWIIESADQLVKDSILLPAVADYLRAIQQ